MPGVMPESSPATGELLDGRYRLDGEIGVGGMGTVYRARDETLGRTVAVKIFRDSAADAARTTSETRLLAGLNHPSLVTLFDAQISSGQPNYLVMEYVDGPTLRVRIADGPLPGGDVAGMARDLAEALHVVHQAGIVHRDIKPSNVLLRRSHVPGEHYRAKLADFGIAYLIDTTRQTTPGTLVGTAAYLSPEQVRGVEPAPASDIYALGLVLVEALTGERAFPQSGTHEAVLARLTRDPVIPGTFGYGWKSLLTAMTAREPAQRPTALDVVLAANKLGAPEHDDPDALTTELRTSELGTSDLGTGEPSAGTSALASTLTKTGADVAATAPALTGPTAILPAPHAEPEHPVRSFRLKRWQVVVAIAALLVIAVIVGVLIWALGASNPADAPVLPELSDPLGTHMQQLLDSVAP